MTTRTLREMKERKEKIAALTCYDAATARLLNEESVDVLLVGDSVANVKLGYENTLPVTLEEMLHHTRAAKRGNSRALLVADVPFLTYEFDPADAVRSVGRLVKAGGAEAVKVEGSTPEILRSIRALVDANIPVVGHLGLTPQSVLRLGGYRVQGRGAGAARAILKGARALEKAGVFLLVLEAVPAAVGRAVTRALRVVDDLLGLTHAPRPKFVRAYADLRAESARAVRAWRKDVKARRFPGPNETYL